MNKKVKWIGMSMLAASLAAGLAGGASWAQVGMVPQGKPAMPKPVAGVSTPVMETAPVASTPMMGSSPTMPQSVTPLMAEVPPTTAPVAMGAIERQTNALREISAGKAELELLRVQAEIDKFKKTKGEDVPKKDEVSSSLQLALEAAKRDQIASSPVVDAGPPVTLLATFSTPDQPKSGYAELKVGDLLVHAKVGDRLPSGHYVKAINFDSVELSKSKKAVRGKVQYISPTDTASVYGSRARSGVSVDGASTATTGVGQSPSGLPPIPTGR